MTREEALKRVKGYLTDYISADYYREVEEIMEALEQEPCEDAISQKIDEFELNGKIAEIWIVKGKLQIRYLGVIHNIPLLSVTPKEKTGWIPVSERLPEEDGDYCVMEKSGRVCTYVFHKNGNSEEYWKRCTVAWIEPYKAESECNK